MSQQRRYSRFTPEEDRIEISTPGGYAVLAEVTDESFGGLGARIPAADAIPGLAEGQEISVATDAGSYDAIIVSLRVQGEMLHLGIKWLETDAADSVTAPGDEGDE